MKPTVWAQPPLNGYTPSGLAPGAPAGSFELSHFENINLYNGNNNFTLTLMQMNGRDGATMPISLAIDPTKWNVRPTVILENRTIWTADSNWWTGYRPGYGPGLLQGRRVGDPYESICGPIVGRYKSSVTRFTFTSSNGTEFEFVDQASNGQPVSRPCDTSSHSRGRVFVTTNGASATFVSDTDILDGNSISTPNVFFPSGYLMFRDGTRYRIDNATVTWIRDRNGNLWTFTHNNSKQVTSIRDSLNRTVIIEYNIDEGGIYGQCDRIIYKGNGGAQRIIRISKTNMGSVLRPGFTLLTNEQLFPELDGHVGLYDPTVVSAVWLPDNRKYQFFYNSYGELARVVVPTGGAMEYDYTPTPGVFNGWSGNTPDRKIYRRIIERRLYPNGADIEKRTKFIAAYSGVSDPPPFFTTITVEERSSSDSLLSSSRHYYYGSPLRSLFSPNATSYPSWNEGLEYKTEHLAADGATLLRREDRNYQPRVNYAWASFEPQLRSEVTTLTDVSPNMVTQKTFTYDQYNNQTEVYEYGFGAGAPGPLLRRTLTFYLTNNQYQGNINYATDFNIHIRNLPTLVQVYDGNGVELSRTYFNYDRHDSYPLQDCPGIIQHDSAFNTAYQLRGNLTLVVKLASINPNSDIYLHNQYDVAGNVVRTTDPHGNPTLFEYSDRFGLPNGEAQSNSAAPELGGLSSYAFPTKVTNALGHTTFTQYDYYLGKLVDTEDPNGVDTAFFYNDALNRLTQVVRSANIAATNNQTTFSYNDAARTITTTSDRDLYGDDLFKSEVLYDGLGRTIESRLYETGSAYIVVNTVYDGLGRASQVSNPHRPGEPVAWTTTGYDALGRVIRVTTPDGAQVNTQYSGNHVTVTDQAGKRRWSETDALNRLTRVIEDPGVLNYETVYLYDALNNLRKVTQGAQTRWFAYDALSRLTRVKIPEQNTNNNIPAYTDPVTGNNQWSMQYSYDHINNILWKRDARNVFSKHRYDALNRLTSIEYQGTFGISPELARYYFYDNPNPEAYGKGRLWKQYVSRLNVEPFDPDQDYTSIERYDPFGRPLTKRQEFVRNDRPASFYIVSQTYDLAGNVKTITYPSGHTVNYSYDNVNRLTGFSGNLGDGLPRTYSTTTQYHPAGMIEREGFGTQIPLYLKRRYNKRLQIGDLRLGTVNDATNADRGALLFYYGPNAVASANPFQDDTTNNGNLWRQVHQVPKPTGGGDLQPQIDDYTYDALNRISGMTEAQIDANGTLVQNVVRQTYGYDQYGNRRITSAIGGVNSYNPTYDQTTNRIVGLGYDAAGNITSDPMTGGTMTYDVENRLLTTTSGGSYAYDTGGKRVRRIAGGQETWYVYGLRGELVAEYNVYGAVGSPLKEYGYRNGQLLVVWDGSETGDRQLQWLVQDHLGSTRMVVDRSGSLAGIRLHDFLPFGEELFAGVGIRSASLGYSGDSVRQKYTGKERDSESSLDYFYARYHSSIAGRFTSVDPYDPIIIGGNVGLYAAQPQNWNRYTYAYNNPLKYVDPNGENPIVSSLIGGALGGLIGGGIELAKQAYTSYKERGDFSGISGRAVLGKAVRGAIFGAVVGLTANPAAASAAITTLSGTATAATVGVAEATAALATAGAVSGIADRAIAGGDPLSMPDVLIDTIAAGVGGGVGQAAYLSLYGSSLHREVALTAAIEAERLGLTRVANVGGRSIMTDNGYAQLVSVGVQKAGENFPGTLAGQARSITSSSISSLGRMMQLNLLREAERYRDVDCSLPGNRCSTSMTLKYGKF
jgi:RHS repeat-associated protein